MVRHTPAALLLVASLTWAVPARPAPLDVVQGIEVYYATVADLTARFTQTFVQKARGKHQVESGILYVKRPRLIRWDYTSPHQKYFVFDGKVAYFYVVEDAQVITDKKFASSKLSRALSFLWGEGKLATTFKVEACPSPPTKICQKPTCGCVLLEPKKPMGEVDRMYLIADPDDFHVHGAVLMDPLGNETRFVFSAIKVNTGLTATWFAFSTPPGVSVLEKSQP